MIVKIYLESLKRKKWMSKDILEEISYDLLYHLTSHKYDPYNRNIGMPIHPSLVSHLLPLRSGLMNSASLPIHKWAFLYENGAFDVLGRHLLSSSSSLSHTLSPFDEVALNVNEFRISLSLSLSHTHTHCIYNVFLI